MTNQAIIEKIFKEAHSATPQCNNQPTELQLFGALLKQGILEALETKDLEAQERLREIAEVYIGSEGKGGAQTAYEAYLEHIIKEMYELTKIDNPPSK